MWALATTAMLVAMVTGGSAAECKMEDTECEFHLVIEHHLTMMKYRDAVYPEKGKLWKWDVTNISDATPVEHEPGDGLIQGDGYEPQMLVLVANKSMPGPTLEVYEGQTVIVHVENHLHSEAVTIHWHGLHQRETTFMDGVAFLTQCPILPGQTFTYKFKADPSGTFWYHSHIGDQRTQGLFGPLIVHKKEPKKMEEHLMSLQDWNHDTPSAIFLKMYLNIFENRKKHQLTTALDGSLFGHFMFVSGLINGKGRMYHEDGTDNGAPLTLYKVKKGNQYRFRVIAAGNLHVFQISVDQHELTMVASDGYEIKPRIAEAFIINPGERYDFIINADKPVGNYWVRAKTLEVQHDHHVEAILRYDGAPDEEPTSSPRTCTEEQPCEVVNCPFLHFNVPHRKCILFDELRSLDGDPAPEIKEGKFKEYFYNWAFPGINAFPGQVNGRTFLGPKVSAISQWDEVGGSCEDADCGEDRSCKCTHKVDLDYKDTVQMVFIDYGRGKWFNHPIHLHGHSFYVVKMGYAPSDPVTGKITGDNLDIECPNTTYNFCNNPKWRNSSWFGDNIPGLELENPPRKDTIIVPTGGYAVIRIRADNPGLWFMHCHIENHAEAGMAMMVNEAYDRWPAIPKGFPTCSPQPENAMTHHNGPDTTKPHHPEPTKPPMGGTTKKSMEGGSSDKPMFTNEVFWTVVGCLIGLCVLQFLLLVCFCFKRRENKTEKPNHYATQNKQGEMNKSFKL